jgi:ketosteroid isomerase-like protein
MAKSTAVEVVREFWRLMASNDFSSVAAVLAPEFVLEWPQSGERIRGAEQFARMNEEYIAHGPWRFTIRRIVGGAAEGGVGRRITDGVQHARAVSFFSVAGGKITHLVEYWPELYPAPQNRAHLVEPIE